MKRTFFSPALFALPLGSRLLIRELPSILDGSAKSKARPQDNSIATLAPKVRAFAGWPGTRAKVSVTDPESGRHTVIEFKIITTRVYENSEIQSSKMDDVFFEKGSLVFACGGGTKLEVLELQLPGKKVVNAASFWNGLRGQKLKKLSSVPSA
ncbi:hypothetical protein PHJA_000025900 [Phtheirospermum japonicum]|uniref:Formyl transferase C-terminal domain-containing protein n=1 Tax=Phtheirospermum japonicum TaxID=374723 RepID=A0A830B310_9LAMI|nr:hypothetical protein PHJA_000025900 [Phtheirospermum japonicum]